MTQNKGRGGFSKEFKEEVVLANNIVSVASRYMQLKSKGKQHWGNCPFHIEKTPSFAINENQQFYHCFGCKASGNVISLVMQLESVDFFSAVELLAKWANIAMPTVAVDPDYLAKKKRKERALECLELAKDFYCANLYKQPAKPMLEYLYKRGITDELIKTFNIGASLDWDGVVKLLKSKGYSDDEIVNSGVAAKSEKGRVYDAMAERITFAIFDIYSSCIGFTGRTMSDEVMPKYRNTSQTMVFDKSNLVYGMDVLKKNKLANFVDKLIVVEGNVDVISLVGAGFINTLACMGTAMTPFHARVFKRFSPNIYLCFDGDTAGRKAAMRSLDILAAEGLNTRVITMPKDVDPDTYLAQHGKESFQELMDKAKPMIDYKLDELENASNLNDNQGKADYLKGAIEVLKSVSLTESELYIPKISKVARVSHEAIKRDIIANQSKSGNTGEWEPPQDLSSLQITNKYISSLNFILACLLHGKVKMTDEYKSKLQLKNKHYMELLGILGNYQKDLKTYNVGLILEDLDDEEKQQIKHLIDFEFTLDDHRIEDEFKTMMLLIEDLTLKRQRDELNEKVSQTTSTDEILALSKQIKEINDKINKLKAKGSTK